MNIAFTTNFANKAKKLKLDIDKVYPLHSLLLLDEVNGEIGYSFSENKLKVNSKKIFIPFD
jgi:hypothetical protein